jgi:hypothetical protein
MNSRQDVPFLKRCGLTLDTLAEAAYACEPEQAVDPSSFSIQMLNDVMLSDCARPSVPTATGRLELLRVERHGDVLAIAEIRGRRRGRAGSPVESVGARLYALKTIAMHGVTVFMFLSKPPAGMSDEKFLAANGTVALYDNAPNGPRALKACGIDRNSGECLSWIFNAVET